MRVRQRSFGQGGRPPTTVRLRQRSASGSQGGIQGETQGGTRGGTQGGTQGDTQGGTQGGAQGGTQTAVSFSTARGLLQYTFVSYGTAKEIDLTLKCQ